MWLGGVSVGCIAVAEETESCSHSPPPSSAGFLATEHERLGVARPRARRIRGGVGRVPILARGVLLRPITTQSRTARFPEPTDAFLLLRHRSSLTFIPRRAPLALRPSALANLPRCSPISPITAQVFFLTSLLSCVVSNSATVVLLYSVLRRVQVPGLRPIQPLLMLMLGASAAFSTPIGYQTNLMVLARGGYRFGDFTALGSILTLVVGTVAALLAWLLPESLL